MLEVADPVKTAAQPNSNQFCKEWNYSGKCRCSTADTYYKSTQRCHVCDSHDYAMLMCPKCKYLIPTVPLAFSFNSPSDQAARLFSLVAVLNEVREFAFHNFLGAQCPVASNVNVDSWSRYLDHYQDRVILDFLHYGWPVNYTSSVLASSTFHTHPSAAKNYDYLSSYTLKDFSYWSVFGAFRCNPFNTHCMIFPLLCVPKHDSLDLRIDPDLSFPKRTSINDGTSNDHYVGEFYLCLPGIDHLVHFVNVKGHGCHVFKKDLKRAF